MGLNEKKTDEELIRRFGLYRIIEHSLLIILFIALLITGLPQKFYFLHISHSILLILGGIDNARAIHHIAAMLFVLLALQHIIINFFGTIFFQWKPSMLITFKDFHDAVHNVRYYLGIVEKPAMCGRYTYKEKCIYWLVLTGGLQMIITGLILWFPITITKYVHGQVIPIAKTIHSSEAMLLFVLVVTWHIYDSILSPDVFPLNKSIFTGYMPKKQMKRLHPLELQWQKEEADLEAKERVQAVVDSE